MIVSFSSIPVCLLLFHKKPFLQEIYHLFLLCRPVKYFEYSTMMISAALAYLESIGKYNTVGLRQLLDYPTHNIPVKNWNCSSNFGTSADAATGLGRTECSPRSASGSNRLQ